MSTTIGRLEKIGSRDVELSLTRYWGGAKHGVCIQLTAEEEKGSTGYVQLSLPDIISLIPIIKKYIIEYSLNVKKVILDDEIKGLDDLS